MKNVKVLTAKVLEVQVKELNSDSEYSFEALEFANGLILIPSSTTNDWFFEDREEIEPCGTAVVSEVIETEETRKWKTSDLLASIQGSMREFGIDSVPAKHLELWK